MIRNAADFSKVIEKSIKNTNLNPEETVLVEVAEFFEKGGRAGELVKVLKDTLKCALCLDIPIQCSISRCKHIFCIWCIKIWWLTSQSCPVCKSPCTIEPVHLATTDTIVEIVMDKYDRNYPINRLEALNTRFLIYYNKWKPILSEDLFNLYFILKMIFRAPFAVYKDYSYMPDRVLRAAGDYNNLLVMFPATIEKIGKFMELVPKLRNEYAKIRSVCCPFLMNNTEKNLRKEVIQELFTQLNQSES